LIINNLVEVGDHHMFTSIANSMLQSIVLNTLLEGKDDFTSDHINDLMKIMNATEGVISAEIPKKIDEIANTVYLQSDYKKFQELEISEVPEWLEENSPVAYRQYNQFLRTYGHRCLNEFCLISTPWEKNTAYIIKMIQDNLKRNCLGQGHVHQETEVKYVVEDLVTPKSCTTKLIIRFLTPYCRISVQRREESKKFINIFYKYFKKIFYKII